MSTAQFESSLLAMEVVPLSSYAAPWNRSCLLLGTATPMSRLYNLPLTDRGNVRVDVDVDEQEALIRIPHSRLPGNLVPSSSHLSRPLFISLPPEEEELRVRC
jgi:hypothetical protein